MNISDVCIACPASLACVAGVFGKTLFRVKKIREEHFYIPSSGPFEHLRLYAIPLDCPCVAWTGTKDVYTFDVTGDNREKHGRQYLRNLRV